MYEYIFYLIVIASSISRVAFVFSFCCRPHPKAYWCIFCGVSGSLCIRLCSILMANHLFLELCSLRMTSNMGKPRPKLTILIFFLRISCIHIWMCNIDIPVYLPCFIYTLLLTTFIQSTASRLYLLISLHNRSLWFIIIHTILDGNF